MQKRNAFTNWNLFISFSICIYASVSLSIWSTKRLETRVLCFCLSWKYLHLNGMYIYIMHSMLFHSVSAAHSLCLLSWWILLSKWWWEKSLFIEFFFADLLNPNCHIHHHSWRQQEVPVLIHWNQPLRMIPMRNQRSPKRRKRKKALAVRDRKSFIDIFNNCLSMMKMLLIVSLQSDYYNTDNRY